MGGKNSKKNPQEFERNRKISEKLKEEEKSLKNNVCLLILGAGDSGKTTLLKQLNILFKKGFTNQDYDLYKEIIRSNIIIYIKTLLEGAAKMKIPLEKKNKSIADDFLEIEIPYQLTKEVAENAKVLWQDPALKETFQKRSVLELPDNAHYFLDQIDKIVNKSFIPNETDILNCRIPTTGVTAVEFGIQEQKWTVIDVGGQRSERRKWMNHFDNATLIIYVLAVSEFDQQLFEDIQTNRLQESISLFENTISNPILLDKGCVVLLNKIDVFSEKIQKKQFKDFFPEYNGENKSESILQFLKMKFVEIGKSDKRKVATFFTCAIDTNDIKSVFDQIQLMVLEKKMTRDDLL
ncbi:guanine nucleotide-binding protein g(o) subunit alpha [Anaeramoeba ignava]|uniref:Guanine nucleotide-binding protein g(O) subunit alpha n=1 Tax=Anaeramoeba ignava TaxID=1746090 RepID=A0A9Q0LFF2_ANAIG|nr:guanine nucleotide-binding protein g(o) subunit alpha [Anaeramoeba ignava]|eukprot:Anaeramoba_ignava/a347750_54.p1 GENE.a347750_54~~a347750_54.p1  ORF type:complete len:350 (-),score=124.49 a347750_54:244-1293(-)